MKIFKNISIILLPLLCGIFVNSFIDTESYKILNKPPLSPPAILFPIVWTILYLLMGISLYIIVRNRGKIYSFILQLAINLIWPSIFFTFRAYYFAIIWLILLIYFVISMISDFLKTKKIAAYLQFPYFIWLLYALYLNIGVAILN